MKHCTELFREAIYESQLLLFRANFYEFGENSTSTQNFMYFSRISLMRCNSIAIHS